MFGAQIVYAEDILQMPLGTRISAALTRYDDFESYRIVRWGRSRKRLQQLKNEGFYLCIRDYRGAEYRKEGSSYYDV